MSGPLPNSESTLTSSICAGMSSPPKRIGRATSLSGLPASKYANRLSPLEAPGLRIELRCDCASRSTSNGTRSEEHTSELQSPCNLVCRLLLEKKKKHNLTTARPRTTQYRP